MLYNNIKIALRTLSKHRMYFLLNTLGLTIGIAASLLIFLFIRFELSYDEYHSKKDRIYKITEDLKTENELLFQASSSPPMGPTFQRVLPEVKSYVRFLNSGNCLVKKEEEQHYEEDVYLVDNNVFEVFDWELTSGNPKTALEKPYTVVLTEEIAKKYFGDENPIGQSFSIDGDECEITGVLKKIPLNSHFRFTMLVSMETFMQRFDDNLAGAWFWNSFYTYLLLEEGEGQIDNLRDKVQPFIKEEITDKLSGVGMFYQDLPLQKLTDIYLAEGRAWENGERGNANNVSILSTMAILILLIAVINYMNLATAQASLRTKEIGVRKVSGAKRSNLMWQFLTESVVISCFSMVLAILVVWILLPYFNEILNKQLGIGILFEMPYIFLLLLGALFTGIVSGSYPALILSNFKPVNILKGSSKKVAGSSLLRKVLVVSQFAISMMLIAGTILVYQQLNFLKNKPLGLQKDQMLVISFNGHSSVRERVETFKNEFKNIPKVKGVSASQSIPSGNIGNNYAHVEIEEGKMSPTNINPIRLDYDFILLYGIEMAEGRNFSLKFPADDTTAYILNEAAVKNFGFPSLEAAIGKKFVMGNREGTIVGVTKDFNYKSLHKKIEPLVMYPIRNGHNYFTLKVESGEMQKTLAAVEAKWKALAPELPFNFFFLDQNFDGLYTSEDQLHKTVIVFSGVAIWIACLGLFGLASFAVARRLREIGIRKVLGASISGIFMMVIKDFSGLIFIALGISIPVTNFFIGMWLDDFAFKISIGYSAFLIAGVAGFLIAGLTVSYQSLKAARVNPVNTLRAE